MSDGSIFVFRNIEYMINNGNGNQQRAYVMCILSRIKQILLHISSSIVFMHLAIWPSRVPNLFTFSKASSSLPIVIPWLSSKDRKNCVGDHEFLWERVFSIIVTSTFISKYSATVIHEFVLGTWDLQIKHSSNLCTSLGSSSSLLLFYLPFLTQSETVGTTLCV